MTDINHLILLFPQDDEFCHLCSYRSGLARGWKSKLLVHSAVKITHGERMDAEQTPTLFQARNLSVKDIWTLNILKRCVNGMGMFGLLQSWAQDLTGLVRGLKVIEDPWQGREMPLYPPSRSLSFKYTCRIFVSKFIFIFL